MSFSCFLRRINPLGDGLVDSYVSGLSKTPEQLTAMNTSYDPALNDIPKARSPLVNSGAYAGNNTYSTQQELKFVVSGEDKPISPKTEIVIGILPGEGVGAEVISCSLKVLDAVSGVTGLSVKIREGGVIGRQAECICGTCLPEDVVAFCRNVFEEGGAILNGPGGGRYVYDLRKQLGLFFKASPLIPANGVIEASRLKPEWIRNLDIIVTRENDGGIYQGEWSSESDSGDGRLSRHTFQYTEGQVRRFLEVSARIAQSRRGEMAIVWKEFGIPSISKLWKDCAAEIASKHDVQYTMIDIDLMAYRLIHEPSCFDVIATPNLFGDVIADLGATLIGSRGISFSGNFSPKGDAVYQTNHGAAYPLAGKDQANPAGQIFSLAMMLRESFGLRSEAWIMEEAVRSVWKEGYGTFDVDSPGRIVVGTREFGNRVAERAEAIARTHS